MQKMLQSLPEKLIRLRVHPEIPAGALPNPSGAETLLFLRRLQGPS